MDSGELQEELVVKMHDWVIAMKMVVWCAAISATLLMLILFLLSSSFGPAVR